MAKRTKSINDIENQWGRLQREVKTVDRARKISEIKNRYIRNIKKTKAYQDEYARNTYTSPSGWAIHQSSATGESAMKFPRRTYMGLTNG